MEISDEKLVEMYEAISGHRVGENPSRRATVIKEMRDVVTAKSEQEAAENFDLWGFETEDALIAAIKYIRGGGRVLDAKAGARPGATGKFPDGKLNEDDEGELRLAVFGDQENGVVTVLFGKPIVWLGLPPGEAREFARLIVEHADKIEGP